MKLVLRNKGKRILTNEEYSLEEVLKLDTSNNFNLYTLNDKEIKELDIQNVDDDFYLQCKENIKNMLTLSTIKRIVEKEIDITTTNNIKKYDFLYNCIFERSHYSFRKIKPALNLLNYIAGKSDLEQTKAFHLYRKAIAKDNATSYYTISLRAVFSCLQLVYLENMTDAYGNQDNSQKDILVYDEILRDIVRNINLDLNILTEEYELIVSNS